MILFRKLFSFYWRYISSPEKYARHLGVTIGTNCLIGTRWWPTEPYLIHIGNHVQITNNVQIHTHGGGNTIRQFIKDFDCFGKVTIEDWAYIGANTLIMPGVTIGKGALVAAGSVVTKTVQPGMVVGGNPARVICTVEEYLERNKEYNLGTFGMNAQEKKNYLLSLPDQSFIKK